MRIINSVKTLVLLFAASTVLGTLPGCVKQDDLELARNDVAMSEVNYQHASERYKALIAKGADLERLHFELGRLYYEHGDFDKAIPELKQARIAGAIKLLAIAYYRVGNFTDALMLFNHNEIADDEYLYYQGLTSEKLNLFDSAIDIYAKVKGEKFRTMARLRYEAIKAQGKAALIKDLDQDVYKIISAAPDAQNYPQAGALILSSDEKVEITKEGTEISTLHHIIKILNERGKENFSEAHIEYDSTYEKVELEYARTIRPDGGVVNVGSSHIRDVSKYLNFPLYSNVHVYIISFPEVTEEATIEYKLKIYNNKLINKKDFVLGNAIQAQEPVIAANFSVTLPRERKLNLKTINEAFNDFAANLTPDIKENSNGSTGYYWQFKNIPAIIPEPGMPPEVQINPAVLLSTFNNWKEIYDWWWPLAKDKIKADDTIKVKVQELLNGLVTDEEKAREIYNFCAQNIRYVAVEYGQAGYEPHFAADIYRNKYGDCKDQAILLITMLKEANLAAWPVLIATKEYFNLNPDFPAVLFNHCIAAVQLKDNIIFLDPTAQTCSFDDLPPGDQGRKVLVFKEDGFETLATPVYPAGHNLIRQYLKLKIDKDEGITAAKSISTLGFYDEAERYWLLYTQPDAIEDTIKQRIQDICIGAELEKYKIEHLEDLNKPVVLSYTFNGGNYFTSAGELRILPQLASADTSLITKEKRRYPIEFDALDSKETVFEIELPDSFAIQYLPQSVSEDSPWIKFSAQYSQKDNKIFFKQIAELKKNAVSNAEYPDFKRFSEDIARKIKQRIVLRKIR